jgi:benzoate/toluate 1,2-dioxygenase alpha subunit
MTSMPDVRRAGVAGNGSASAGPVDPAAGLVDRTIYTDPEVLALEHELIFRRTWHFACLAGELTGPGDFFTVTVAGEPVLVVRGDDGGLRAFYNACTHRAAVLTGERGGNCGRIFKCMYHAWSFSLRGELIAVPYEEGYGPEFDKSRYGLIPVACQTFGDLVFVALDPLVPRLADYLGEMTATLEPYVTGIEPIGRNSWVYEGNWKLWHENFRDNYHPEFTHRMIHDMTPHYADRGGNWGLAPGHSRLQWVAEAPDLKGYAKSMTRRSGVVFDSGAPSAGYADVGEEKPQEVLAIFPNLDLQPGPKDGTKGERTGYVQTVTPVGVDRARVEITVYSAADDAPEERQWALENLADSQGSWGKISCDDTEAAYRCQLGVSGNGTRHNIFTRGTTPGRGGQDADGRDEYSQREFYRVYQQYMGSTLGG